MEAVVTHGSPSGAGTWCAASATSRSTSRASPANKAAAAAVSAASRSRAPRIAPVMVFSMRYPTESRPAPRTSVGVSSSRTPILSAISRPVVRSTIARVSRRRMRARAPWIREGGGIRVTSTRPSPAASVRAAAVSEGDAFEASSGGTISTWRGLGGATAAGLLLSRMAATATAPSTAIPIPARVSRRPHDIRATAGSAGASRACRAASSRRARRTSW